jgi:hypothetical protein
VRIVRDPTDLMALATLWPAWRLWRFVAVRPEARADRSLLALGLASLAALATAPCPPQLPVRQVLVVEDVAFALTNPEISSDGVYQSSTGSGWDPVDPSSTPLLVAAVAQPVEMPKVVCVAGLEQSCYRAAGEELVEASADGGATWRTVWTAPTVRRSFMQRVANQHGQLLACGKALDFRATDVVILGRGAEHRAIVALGDEGVLVGRAEGPWSRVAVGWAVPTPERGDLKAVLAPALIVGETAAAWLAAAASMLLFSIHAWRRFRVPEADGGPKRSDTPLKTGIVVTLLVFILMFSLGIEELIPYAIVPLIGFIAWAVVLWTGWLQTLTGDRRDPRAWTALALSLLGSVLVGMAAWIPFALWVLGILPAYSLALLVAAAAAAGVIVIFWRMIRRRGVATSLA